MQIHLARHVVSVCSSKLRLHTEHACVLFDVGGGRHQRSLASRYSTLLKVTKFDCVLHSSPNQLLRHGNCNGELSVSQTRDELTCVVQDTCFIKHRPTHPYAPPPCRFNRGRYGEGRHPESQSLYRVRGVSELK